MANSAAYQVVEDSIVDDTQRPDFAQVDNSGSSLIMRRIRRSVLKMHRIDFWQKDFIEQIYAFDANQPASMLQVIEESFLPRIRSFGYIRPWDSTASSTYNSQYTPGILGAPRGGPLTEMNVSIVLDGYGYDRQDVFYRSGNKIKVNCSIPLNEVLIGWFQDPFLDPITASDSWILTNYPDLIAADAKRRIFKNIGKDDEAKSSREEYMEEMGVFQTNNIKVAVLQQ